MTLAELVATLNARHNSEGYTVVSTSYIDSFAEYLLAVRAGLMDSSQLRLWMGRFQWRQAEVGRLMRELTGCQSYRCHRCDDWQVGTPVLIAYDNNEAGVCSDCESHYRYCDRCGYTVLRNDRDHRHSQLIYDYSHAVALRARGLTHEHIGPETLMAGVELEVEPSGPRTNIEEVAQGTVATLTREFVCLKHDGSLSERGFEIVSAPATLGFHHTAWDEFMTSEHRKKLKSFDTQTCGMHVHLSKSAISPLTLGKMLVFFNHRDNRRFIQRVAGRRGNHYSQFVDGRKAGTVISAKEHGYGCASYRDNQYRPAMCNCESNYTTSRYEALNLATHKPTVEIRIFKGTLDRESFLKNIEFSFAAVGFCDATGPRELTIEKFIAWVKMHRKIYPFLNLWLERKGFLTPREVPAEYADKARMVLLGIPESNDDDSLLAVYDAMDRQAVSV